MTPTEFILRGSGDVDITCSQWLPESDPTAAIQIAHGVGEHVGRYDELASTLTAQGYAVYGQDHRGHGRSVNSSSGFGVLGTQGWLHLVTDIGVLSDEIRSRHGAIPLVLIAHSMGSFAAQQYLLDHDRNIDALVLTGTAALDLLEPALDLDAELNLAMFNAAFQPARTEFDWLSRDEAIVDAYVADPLCGFGLDIDAVRTMFAEARRMADPDQVRRIRSDLPILLAVGSNDPVNGELALFEPLVERYRTAGITELSAIVYPDARHEIFNETNRVEVRRDLISWLHRVLQQLPAHDSAPQ